MTAPRPPRIRPVTAEALFSLNPGDRVVRRDLGDIMAWRDTGRRSPFSLRMFLAGPLVPDGSGILGIVSVTDVDNPTGTHGYLRIPTTGGPSRMEVRTPGPVDTKDVLDLAGSATELLDGFLGLPKAQRDIWGSMSGANGKVYDYQRHESDAERALLEAGIPQSELAAEPLIFDAFSAAKRIFLR